MNRNLSGSGVALLVAVLTIATSGTSSVGRSSHSNPTQYPHEGDLYYDGGYNADSYMNWHAPGAWVGSDRAVEIAINVSYGYFDSCTIATDLPLNFDDCPTAGSAPDPNRTFFGMGTFDGTQIVPNQWYRAYWYFSGGRSLNTSVNNTWGEVTRQFCTAPYDIWCYGQVAGGSLKTTNWSFGTPSTVTYLWEM